MAKQTGYPSIDKPWLKYYSEEATFWLFIGLYDIAKDSGTKW